VLGIKASFLLKKACIFIATQLQSRYTKPAKTLRLRWEDGASSTGYAACTAAGERAIAPAGQSSFPCGRLSTYKRLSRNDRLFISNTSLPNQTTVTHAERSPFHVSNHKSCLSSFLHSSFFIPIKMTVCSTKKGWKPQSYGLTVPLC
jgi:hypothetical protein